MFRAQFFLGNRYVGEGDVPWEEFKEQRAVPASRGFYCRRCGQVFARIVVTGAPSWRYEERLCTACGHEAGIIAGSIYYLTFGEGSPRCFPVEALPPQFLKHEFERHLSYFFGDSHDEDSGAAAPHNGTTG